MTVEVTEEKDFLFQNLFDVAQEAFGVKDFWVDHLARISPSPVQILAGQPASVTGMKRWSEIELTYHFHLRTKAFTMML